MQQKTKNGISVELTEIPYKTFIRYDYDHTDGELFSTETIELARALYKTFVMYEYRHIDGDLFKTGASDLKTCRQRRDNWLESKNDK